MNCNLLNIKNYYNGKIIMYGTTSKGVDWKDKESQCLRFSQILKVIDISNNFTIGDLGCGYGGLLNFLYENNYKNFVYSGYDISENMINEAQKQYNKNKFKLIKDTEELDNADFIVASGIFNVRLSEQNSDWDLYIKKTVKQMFNKCYKGISFNILSLYSDKECRKDYLYYADPLYYFDFLKKNLTHNVALLHDYGLFEFTIILRK